MAKASYVNIAKPARKRSSATGTLVGVRLQDDEIKAIDGWASKQEPPVTRPYAIRRLVEIGLTVRTNHRRQAPAERAARAKELASKAIDSLTGEAPSNDETASRKRRLIKGPEEFREIRADRTKTK
jgi:hypothetical protein